MGVFFCCHDDEKNDDGHGCSEQSYVESNILAPNLLLPFPLMLWTPLLSSQELFPKMIPFPSTPPGFSFLDRPRNHESKLKHLRLKAARVGNKNFLDGTPSPSFPPNFFPPFHRVSIYDHSGLCCQHSLGSAEDETPPNSSACGAIGHPAS